MSHSSLLLFDSFFLYFKNIFQMNYTLHAILAILLLKLTSYDLILTSCFCLFVFDWTFCFILIVLCQNEGGY